MKKSKPMSKAEIKAVKEAVRNFSFKIAPQKARPDKWSYKCPKCGVEVRTKRKLKYEQACAKCDVAVTVTEIK